MTGRVSYQKGARICYYTHSTICYFWFRRVDFTSFISRLSSQQQVIAHNAASLVILLQCNQTMAEYYGVISQLALAPCLLYSQ